jgi:hypothetical protein
LKDFGKSMLYRIQEHSIPKQWGVSMISEFLNSGESLYSTLTIVCRAPYVESLYEPATANQTSRMISEDVLLRICYYVSSDVFSRTHRG